MESQFLRISETQVIGISGNILKTERTRHGIILIKLKGDTDLPIGQIEKFSTQICDPSISDSFWTWVNDPIRCTDLTKANKN